MRLLYSLVAILAIRLILNLSKYIRARRYHDEYLSRLTVKRTSKLLEKRAQVVALLKNAGVDDSYVGIAEPGIYARADRQCIVGTNATFRGALKRRRVHTFRYVARFILADTSATSLQAPRYLLPISHHPEHN